MGDTTSTQSQVADGQNQQVLPGSQGSQAGIASDGEQPGAGKEGQQVTQTEAQTQAEKTYSAKEWSEREAAKDREIAQYKGVISQIALRQQIDSARAEEERFAKIDQEAVEEGELTATQAVDRAQKREQARQQEFALRQQRELQKETLSKMASEGERLGRVLAAHDFATKHGVDVNILLNDASLKTPEQMALKAERLALEKERAALKGSETFDSGQQGGSGIDRSNMSPMELAAHAYNQSETKRKRR